MQVTVTNLTQNNTVHFFYSFYILIFITAYAQKQTDTVRTQKLSKDIERVQKRCLRLLYPSISYSDALRMSSLDRRDMNTQKVFREIKDPKHPLHNILPPVKVSYSQMTLRSTYPYQVPFCKNTR